MDLTIRPVEPVDVPFIAWVQQAASRFHLPFGFWDGAIPGPDEYRLRILVAGPAARAHALPDRRDHRQYSGTTGL